MSPSQFVHSPNYPNAYDPHDDCTWNIEVAPGHTVNFQFMDFDLEPMPSHAESACPYDYVALYDGPHTESPLLAKVENKYLNFVPVISV